MKVLFGPAAAAHLSLKLWYVQKSLGDLDKSLGSFTYLFIHTEAAPLWLVGWHMLPAHHTLCLPDILSIRMCVWIHFTVPVHLSKCILYINYSCFWRLKTSLFTLLAAKPMWAFRPKTVLYQKKQCEGCKDCVGEGVLFQAVSGLW